MSRSLKILCFEALFFVAIVYAESSKNTFFYKCCLSKKIPKDSASSVCNYDRLMAVARSGNTVTEEDDSVKLRAFNSSGSVMNWESVYNNLVGEQPSVHPRSDLLVRMETIKSVLLCMADYKNNTPCCAEHKIPKECLKLCDLSKSADLHFNLKAKEECDAVIRKEDQLIAYQCYEKNAYNKRP